MAANALAATRAAGLKSNIVFVPRPSATPAQEAAARETGVVSPLYTGVPAPLGVAYYGLSGTGEGSQVGTILNTTAVRGYVDANATGINGLDLYQSSPDSYGIQLNSVLTNVSLFGQPGYSFWTQNVVEYYPAVGLMFLITNIWNFSGASYTGHEFYSTSTIGFDDSSDYAELGYYYAELEIPFQVTYPFNLTLTMNSGITGGRDNMSFSVALTNPDVPSEDFDVNNWDGVVFNSSAIDQTPSLTQPSPYTANGLQYNPIGLTDDFELDICGPGGGSQVDLSTADASLGLAYLSDGQFVSVPAAYNYGGETGETAIGANIAWSDAPGGPGGLADYATATTGPAVLSGLWGNGAPEGSYPVTLVVSPGNAFNFFQYAGTATFSEPIVNETSYAPSITTTTFYLMPGEYELLTELSDYTYVNSVVDVVGPTVVPIALTPDPSLGVYTPLWAFSNAEVAALATSGAGTPSSPYILVNNQFGTLSADFGLYNDYTFPVFPGVFLYGTTVSVELYHPPSFSTATNDFQFPGDDLPQTNDLQYWFWDVQNAAIVGASNISGWFGQYAWYPIDFDSFNVIFYESSHNLIAGNTFDTESQALLLFSGGGVFAPPVNIGGGNNTIWGNTFNEVPGPAGCPSDHCETLLYYSLGLGIEIAENNDLIYNNYIATPTTAWLLPLNMYSDYPEFFVTTWNITPVAATVVNYAAGFPGIPLTGSITGGATQGGNYWWDYGLTFNPFNGADNPYNVLPYDENAFTFAIDVVGPSYYYASYIYPGGDYAPLSLPAAGPAVTFVEHGLNAGTTWGADVSVDGLSVGFVTNANYYTLSVFPAGRYPWAPASPAPAGYVAPAGGSFRLSDHPITVGVSYHLAVGYSYLTIRESGLPHGTAWSVEIGGTSPATDAFNTTASATTASVKVVVKDGDYTFFAPGIPGWLPSPSSGSLVVTGSTSLHITYHADTWGLTFLESGIPFGLHWGITLSGPITGKGTERKTETTIFAALDFLVPNGTYTFTIIAPAHTTCTASPSSPIVFVGSPPPGTDISVNCVYSGGHAPAANPAAPSLAPAAAVVRETSA